MRDEDWANAPGKKVHYYVRGNGCVVDVITETHTDPAWLTLYENGYAMFDRARDIDGTWHYADHGTDEADKRAKALQGVIDRSEAHLRVALGWEEGQGSLEAMAVQLKNRAATGTALDEVIRLTQENEQLRRQLRASEVRNDALRKHWRRSRERVRDTLAELLTEMQSNAQATHEELQRIIITRQA